MRYATRRILKRAGPFAAIAAALALMLVPSASPQSGPPYADPTGDSGSAPDVTGVTVSSEKASGQIIFRVALASVPTTNSIIELDVDSDANPATGDSNSNGADYAFQVDPTHHEYGFWHWNGSDWVDTSYATVRVGVAGNGVMFSVNKSELGGTSEFNFGVFTFFPESTDLSHDSAPDDGLWNYSIDAGGPDIQGLMLQTTPSSGPRAGKLFVVTPVGLKLPPSGALFSDQAHPESYTCRATIKSRALAGAGTGGCTLRIPKKKTRGKTLNVVVTVTYEGATKSVPFTFVVS